SFGGGTSGWLHREMVEKKRWMGEDEFFDTLALCQALPGINITNMAVWSGRRLLGIRGAVSACAGIVVIPSVFIVLISIAISAFMKSPIPEIALGGATAAAIALPLTMGIKMAFKVRFSPVPLAIMAATFVGVGILKIPLITIAPACALISVAWE